MNLRILTIISKRLHRESSQKARPGKQNMYEFSRASERANSHADRKNFHPLPTPEGNRFFYVSAICHVNSIVT